MKNTLHFALILTLALLLAACNTPTPSATLIPEPNLVPTTPAVSPTATPTQTPAPTEPVEPALPELRGSLTLTPDFAGAGDSITVQGSGFNPNEDVLLMLGFPNSGPVGEVLGAAIADASGSFSTTIIIPEGFPSGMPLLDDDLRIVAADDNRNLLTEAELLYFVDLFAVPGLVLYIERTGGIAGFCDRLLIFASNEWWASTCAFPAAITSEGLLDEAQQAEVASWVAGLVPMQARQTDGAAADDLTYIMTLVNVNGSRPPGPAELYSMRLLADSLLVAP